MSDTTCLHGGRYIVLSDFAGENLARAQEERVACHAQDLAAYQRKMTALVAIADAREKEIAAAWANWRFLEWLRLKLALRRFYRQPAPLRPEMSLPDDTEARMMAGQEGERRIITALFAVIPPDLLLVSGYRNAAGETDILIVSPHGLMAIEVKNYSGQISCVGDDWRAGKRVHGSLVMKPIQDRGGRPPNHQVNAVANHLEKFFAKMAPGMLIGKVRRGVIFPHPNAVITHVQDPSVHLVCKPEYFTPELFTRLLPPRRAPLDVQKVLALIRRDHAFHQKRSRASTQKN
jgi:hypothetical protein